MEDAINVLRVNLVSNIYIYIVFGLKHNQSLTYRFADDGKMEAVRPPPQIDPNYKPSQFEPMTMRTKENLDPTKNLG